MKKRNVIIAIVAIALLALTGCEKEPEGIYRCEEFHFERDIVIESGLDSSFYPYEWISYGVQDFIELPDESDKIKYECIIIY